jgi:hypothetical protein
MTTSMNLDPLRLAEKRAKLGWLIARSKRLAAELDTAGVPVSTTTAGPLVYSPSWKIGGRPHLSREGKDAILSAFDHGMRPSDVARLFRISERAALNWRARHQLARGKSASTPAGSHVLKGDNNADRQGT